MGSRAFALDIGRTLQGTVERSIAVGLKVVAFAVILLAGWIIASVLGRLTDRTLDRLRFNTAANRSGLDRWTGRYRASELAARLVYYAVVLFALQAGFSVFGPNPVSDVLTGIVHWLPKAFVAMVIVVVTAGIGHGVHDIVDAALGRLVYGPVLARTAQVVISALGVIAALNQIGIATAVTEPILITVLATVGGILVVGLGGGLIEPMRQRWERILRRAGDETTRVAAGLRNTPTGTFNQPAYQTRMGTARQDEHRSPAPTPATVRTPAVRPPGSVL